MTADPSSGGSPSEGPSSADPLTADSLTADSLTADLLAVARSAAFAAGRVLLASRSSVVALGTKSSGTDPVTSADTAAQRAIESVIEAARPDDSLTGEENLSHPGSTGVHWVIDPLDGTVNYLYGRDEWAVSIAARLSRDTVAAVVYAPALNRLYSAIRSSGAWLGERRLAVRRGADLSGALVGTGFSYTESGRAAQAATLARVLPRVADIRRGGSAALDLAAVASGTLDAFYEDDLEEWDWAAGALLATEAGAVVTPLDGPSRRRGILAAAPPIHAPLHHLLLTSPPRADQAIGPLHPPR